MKILKTILTLTIIISGFLSVTAQELRSMHCNPVLLNAKKTEEAAKPFLKSYNQTVPIDSFFEDFSDYGTSTYPSPSKWTDKSAYINSTFADSMISLGVATLDSYDQYGNPYKSLYSNNIPSDTLTSVGITFDGVFSDTVFLSFFYEAGGLGEMPEDSDVLLVDFFSVPHDKWVNVLKIPGGVQQHSFTQVILPVNDSLLKTGFRFRFRNLTSVSGNSQDQQSNADEWNLDYIQLKPATNSNFMRNLDDVAIVAPLLSSLTEYNTVPWRHFSKAQESQRQKMRIQYRACFPDITDSINVAYTLVLYDVDNNLQPKKYPTSGGYQHKEMPVSISTYENFVSSGLSYTAKDSVGRLELSAYLTTALSGPTLNQNKVNDTVHRTEIYYSDYAYDDGSAEKSFGISGENQSNVMMANRFRIYESDTLKAVKIFFNKTYNNSTKDIEFSVCVWNCRNKKPGTFLYESTDTNKIDTLKVFSFQRFNLETPLFVNESDTIFVGIKQSESRFISIGYDVNYNSLRDIYVKTSAADWYNPGSLDTGSLMIRPCFSIYDYPSALAEPGIEGNFTVYPNPTQDVLHIKFPEGKSSESCNYKVMNTLGMTLINTHSNTESLNISELNKGLYFLIITSADSKIIRSAKFIKN